MPIVSVALVVASLLTVASLLVLSGAEKLLRPLPAAQALYRVGVPAPRLAARLVALAELSVGATAIVAGGRLCALSVGLIYLGFLAILLQRHAVGDLDTPCGCFGDEAQPGRWHLAVNAFAVAVVALAAAFDAPGLVTLAGESPGAAALTTVLIAIGALQLRLVLTRLGPIRQAPLVRAS